MCLMLETFHNHKVQKATEDMVCYKILYTRHHPDVIYNVGNAHSMYNRKRGGFPEPEKRPYPYYSPYKFMEYRVGSRLYVKDFNMKAIYTGRNLTRGPLQRVVS